tara:strand:- start:113 stop:577 length:465 start_codon:yes stop_codon:yes gene_type:complete
MNLVKFPLQEDPSLREWRTSGIYRIPFPTAGTAHIIMCQNLQVSPRYPYSFKFKGDALIVYDAHAQTPKQAGRLVRPEQVVRGARSNQIRELFLVREPEREEITKLILEAERSNSFGWFDRTHSYDGARLHVGVSFPESTIVRGDPRTERKSRR